MDARKLHLGFRGTDLDLKARVVGLFSLSEDKEVIIEAVAGEVHSLRPVMVVAAVEDEPEK